MSHRPQVAIIIPCYNDGRFLLGALAKAKRQEAITKEIIVVDDGSTDKDTLAVLNKIEALQDPEIRVLRRPQNKGTSAARNYGIRHAQAPYILTWDADDYFEPSFLREAVPVLQEGDHIAAVSSYYIRGYQVRGGLIRRRLVKLKEGASLSRFLSSNQFLASALFRKKLWEAVGGYDEATRAAEDWDFWIRLAKAKKTFKVIKKPLTHYTFRPDSKLAMRMASKERRQQVQRFLYEKYKEAYDQHFYAVLRHWHIWLFWGIELPVMCGVMQASGHLSKGQRLMLFSLRVCYWLLFPLRVLRKPLLAYFYYKPSFVLRALLGLKEETA